MGIWWPQLYLCVSFLPTELYDFKLSTELEYSIYFICSFFRYFVTQIYFFCYFSQQTQVITLHFVVACRFNYCSVVAGNYFLFCLMDSRMLFLFLDDWFCEFSLANFIYWGPAAWKKFLNHKVLNKGSIEMVCRWQRDQLKN